MPGRTRKIMTPDGEKDAEPVDVTQATEYFNVYQLEDGSTMKLKAVVLDVVRIIDMYDDDGNPIYFARSKNIVTVDAPDGLRRKQE